MMFEARRQAFSIRVSGSKRASPFVFARTHSTKSLDFPSRSAAFADAYEIAQHRTPVIADRSSYYEKEKVPGVQFSFSAPYIKAHDFVKEVCWLQQMRCLSPIK